jgi:hypothetical protein
VHSIHWQGKRSSRELGDAGRGEDEGDDWATGGGAFGQSLETTDGIVRSGWDVSEGKENRGNWLAV